MEILGNAQAHYSVAWKMTFGMSYATKGKINRGKCYVQTKWGRQNQTVDYKLHTYIHTYN